MRRPQEHHRATQHPSRAVSDYEANAHSSHLAGLISSAPRSPALEHEPPGDRRIAAAIAVAHTISVANAPALRAVGLTNEHVLTARVLTPTMEALAHPISQTPKRLVAPRGANPSVPRHERRVSPSPRRARLRLSRAEAVARHRAPTHPHPLRHAHGHDSRCSPTAPQSLGRHPTSAHTKRLHSPPPRPPVRAKECARMRPPPAPPKRDPAS